MITIHRSYADRAKDMQHPIARTLLELMDRKQTNLAVSADVTSCQELLDLAEEVGPEICVLKTHVDILEDFNIAYIERLQEIASRHQFLLFEDRKFADIGNTVQLQYGKGIYRIADWADIVNAHSLPGPGIIDGLKEVGLPLERACLLLAQMSSKHNLLQDAYVTATLEMAKQHKDFIIGFIALQRLLDTPDFIYFTPGVNIGASGDTLGQSYLLPDYVINTCGSDIIIVGRGIYRNPSPLKASQHYRQLGWEAYQKRLGNP